MSRTPKSAARHAEEAAYIEGIATSKDFSYFNGDAECFARYVHMQADCAARDGAMTERKRMMAVLHRGFN